MEPAMRNADIIFIGAGPGAYEAAAAAAAKGCKVILIERDRLGGTCLNRGCIPTKCLCAAAATAMTVASAAEFGINVSSVELDYGKAASRIATVVDQLSQGIASMLKDVEIIHGEARLAPGRIVEVNGEQLTADKIVIATGSAPARLPIPGAGLAVTSDDFLQLHELPQRIAIIGGGVIGLELASVAVAFGREVTVVEYCKEVLPPFDSDIAKRLRMSLTRRGIRFVTSAAVKSIEPGLRVCYECRKGSDAIDCDLAVMAVGRRAVIPEGTAEAGIELDARGYIKVDDFMATSAEGVYAVGDVNGRNMLAHAASAQSRMLMGAQVNLDIIPSVVFTIPEAAMVGLTEDAAKAKGYDVAVGRASYAGNGRALTSAETGGTVKLIFDKQSGAILGGHIVGAGAESLVAEIAALMYSSATRQDLASGLVHAHPTLSEILVAAAG